MNASSHAERVINRHERRLDILDGALRTVYDTLPEGDWSELRAMIWSALLAAGWGGDGTMIDSAECPVCGQEWKD